jgi:hypothetical protein
LKDLPTAVYDLPKLLHMGGQELLDLRTGQAFISYVGKQGRICTMLYVPEVRSIQVSDTEFAEIRKTIVQRSPSAVLIAQAEQDIQERQKAITALVLEAKKQAVEEPEIWAVPQTSNAPDSPDEQNNTGRQIAVIPE